MKKLVSMLIIIVTCACMLVAFTACSSKHPIDEFKEKMENADSYQMTVTMSDVPFFGTFTVTTKVDGNIQYTPAVMFYEEEYIESIGNVKYKYTKDESGKWKKERETTGDDSVYGEEAIEQLFDSENYEKEKGKDNTYKQKEDVTFDGYDDVKITVTEDSCTLEMKATSEGMTFGVKIVISKIGEIELHLPDIG